MANWLTNFFNIRPTMRVPVRRSDAATLRHAKMPARHLHAHGIFGDDGPDEPNYDAVMDTHTSFIDAGVTHAFDGRADLFALSNVDTLEHGPGLSLGEAALSKSVSRG